MPNNRYLLEMLIFFFHSEKTSAEAHRELQKAYGVAALSETTCRDWFRGFKDGDFDVDDRPRKGRTKIFEDADVIYYELLKPNETITHLETLKWLDSWIASKDEHFYRNYIRALPERWAKVVANDV